jgi:hypothetical protein
MKLSELKRSLLKEDTRPAAGIWYFVWLKPVWKLEVYKDTEYGDSTHMDVWAKYVADEIASHYKVDVDKVLGGVDSLRNMYQCMPRGRVFQNLKKEWILAHGNDFPKKYGVNRAKKQIVSSFELTTLFLMGKARFAFDGHETMDKQERALAAKLLGKIPY